MRFAIIENNLVINVIEADENFVNELEFTAIDVTDKICGIGFSFVDGEFHPPVAFADVDDSETL